MSYGFTMYRRQRAEDLKPKLLMVGLLIPELLISN